MTGLVLEGGAMRGLFSAGVMDVLMERGFKPDGVIGVSAGACFGCNFVSGQHSRSIRYNKLMAHESKFCGIKSLLLTGDIYNAEFAYHTLPNEIDKFDNEAFMASPIDFHIVVTDVEAGKAIYKKCDFSGDRLYDWIRASASMPVVSKVVELDGYKLLDGGIADSIPLEYFESIGYDRNLVVLTQPKGYRKKPSRFMPFIKWSLRKYPKVVELMARRHEMYNAEIDYIEKAEAEGRCLVVRPDGPLPIGHISHDSDEMQRVYELGRQAGEKLDLSRF